MHILLLGSGGREHAFAHKIIQSNHCDTLFVAPGNAGTAKIAINRDVDINDFEAVKKLVLEEAVEMLIIGPEVPLVSGITDFFKQDPALREVIVIGPSKRGALLEGSKQRAKEFMELYGIPTASYEHFTQESLEAGNQFLDHMDPPYVLKADGLAAGKGVVILNNLQAAKEELEQMLTYKKFGAASASVVIEQFLKGKELSVFVLTDGKNYCTLPTAKDYKRAGEGDKGLNTGGMGAVSPVPFADEAFMKKVDERIIKPTVKGIQEEDINYRGFIFFGLIEVDGDPYVIEYNVRMGDPETEVVLPRIKSDLVALFIKTGQEKLNTIKLEIDDRAAATVVLVSGGYPGDYSKGKEITGLDEDPDTLFHAGTIEKDGKIVTNGGRVLAVTSMDNNFEKALKKSYERIQDIHFEGMNYRKDIGFDL